MQSVFDEWVVSDNPTTIFDATHSNNITSWPFSQLGTAFKNRSLLSCTVGESSDNSKFTSQRSVPYKDMNVHTKYGPTLVLGELVLKVT